MSENPCFANRLRAGLFSKVMPLRWATSEPDRDPKRKDLTDSGGTDARDANRVAPDADANDVDADRANKERWRLAWHYGEMTDGELEALAADAGSLTDLARRALHSELNKRGLPAELQMPAAAAIKTPRPRKLVTLRRFRDMPEALLAKTILDSAGIFCSLDDVNIIRTDWLWSNLVGGIKLRIEEEDFEAASSLLNENPSVSQAAGEFREPVCPRCRSIDISVEEVEETTTNAGRLVSPAVIAVPIGLATPADTAGKVSIPPDKPSRFSYR